MDDTALYTYFVMGQKEKYVSLMLSILIVVIMFTFLSLLLPLFNVQLHWFFVLIVSLLIASLTASSLGNFVSMNRGLYRLILIPQKDILRFTYREKSGSELQQYDMNLKYVSIGPLMGGNTMKITHKNNKDFIAIGIQYPEEPDGVDFYDKLTDLLDEKSELPEIIEHLGVEEADRFFFYFEDHLSMITKEDTEMMEDHTFEELKEEGKLITVETIE